MQALVRTICLCACMVIAPFLLSLAEQAAGMLVNDIASAAPSMAWLPVPNPGPASLTLDYSKPFNIIAQYIGGNIAPPAGIQFWKPAEDLQYVFRTLLIGAFGFVAAVTVIIMEGLKKFSNFVFMLPSDFHSVYFVIAIEVTICCEFRQTIGRSQNVVARRLNK
jgi:hypothetical protein